MGASVLHDLEIEEVDIFMTAAHLVPDLNIRPVSTQTTFFSLCSARISRLFLPLKNVYFNPFLTAPIRHYSFR